MRRQVMVCEVGTANCSDAIPTSRMCLNQSRRKNRRGEKFSRKLEDSYLPWKFEWVLTHRIGSAQLSDELPLEDSIWRWVELSCGTLRELGKRSRSITMLRNFKSKSHIIANDNFIFYVNCELLAKRFNESINHFLRQSETLILEENWNGPVTRWALVFRLPVLQWQHQLHRRLFGEASNCCRRCKADEICIWGRSGISELELDSQDKNSRLSWILHFSSTQ